MKIQHSILKMNTKWPYLFQRTWLHSNNQPQEHYYFKTFKTVLFFLFPSYVVYLPPVVCLSVIWGTMSICRGCHTQISYFGLQWKIAAPTQTTLHSLKSKSNEIDCSQVSYFCTLRCEIHAFLQTTYVEILDDSLTWKLFRPESSNSGSLKKRADKADHKYL